MALPCVAGGSQLVPYDCNVDYNKPWFVLRDGDEYYCLLCNAFATEDHVASTKHTDRVLESSWYMGDHAPQLPEYDKPWFKVKDGEWFCMLCNQFATEGHLGSERHRKNEAEPEWYGFTGAGPIGGHASSSSTTLALTNGGPLATFAHTAQFNFQWFKQIDGEWYCNLCNKWATDGHIATTKHKTRSNAPGWYGFPSSLSSSGSGAGALPALTQHPHGADTGQPTPWSRHFNKAHEDWYFCNVSTRETTWIEPKGVHIITWSAEPVFSAVPLTDIPAASM
jgi:hypothetical protein